MLKNEITGLDKYPHQNEGLSSECLTCQNNDWFYEQLKIIPEPTYQADKKVETDLDED